jgi:signal peptidase I
MHRRTLAAAAVCLGGLRCLRFWVIEPITVSSGSMEPTIAAGSVVWLNKAAAHVADTPSGQLVAFRDPGGVGGLPEDGLLLKRVVAEGGQSASILDGVLYVDGAPAKEPYVDQRTIDGVYFGTVTVPPGDLFVLGDNRETSIDSRDFGPIPISAVMGTVPGGN